MGLAGGGCGWGESIHPAGTVPRLRYFLLKPSAQPQYAFDGQVFLLLGVLRTAEWSLRGCRGAELVLAAEMGKL